MIIEAQEINGIIIPRHEVSLECSNCGMEVDAMEYVANKCSDCGHDWDEIRHIAIHVTSVPASGQSA